MDVLISYRTLFWVLGCSLIMGAGAASPTADPSQTGSILIFTKAEGYVHASIPAATEALSSYARERGWQADHTEQSAVFHPDTLARYRAVVFLNTTGNVLNRRQQSALKNYIQQGGGFVGIHSAADTEYGWEWYGRMIGAYFDSHPEVQQARLKVEDKDHPSTSFLPGEWIRTDEWYNFRSIQPGIKVLIRLDESSYEGGENGPQHPAAWYNRIGEGRMFYTAGGHTAESYGEPLFLKHLWGGILYASAADG